MNVLNLSSGRGGRKIYFLGDEPIGSGTIDDPIRLATNFTPEPPTLVSDDEENTLVASHVLGLSEILVSVDNASYVQYSTIADVDGIIQVGDVERASGYYKFKIKSAGGRNESSVVNSPEFNPGLTPEENVYPLTMESPVYGGSDTYLTSGKGSVPTGMLPNYPFTNSVMIRTTDVPGSFGVILAQDAAFWIALDSNGKITTFAGGSTITGATTVNDGNWHTITVVRESDTVNKLYVDGVLDAQTSSISGITLSNNYRLRNLNDSFDFIGDTKEVGLWNLARWTSDHTPLASIPNNDAGLIARYPLAGNGYNYAGT